MPVRVTIPIRLRVDPGALTERQADLEGALAAAVGRALVNSRDVVLEPRGGYVGVRIHPPEFSWIGDGLAAVASGTQTETEIIIANCLTQAIQSSNLLDSGVSSDRLNQSLPPPSRIFESIDEERLYSVLGVYEIPSYERRGRTTSPPIQTPPRERQFRDVWRQINPQTISHELALQLKRSAVQRWGTLPTYPRGIIFRETGGWEVLIWAGPRMPTLSLTFENFGHYQYRRGQRREVPVTPSPGRATARRVSIGSSLESRRQAIREFMSEQIRSEIVAGLRRPSTMRQAEYEQQLETALEDQITQLASSIPSDAITLIEVRRGSYYVLLPANATDDAHLSWEGVANLLPITRSVEVTPPATEETGTGESQEGGTTGESAGGEEVTRSAQGGVGTGDGLETGEGEGDSQGQGGFVYTGEAAVSAESRGQVFPVTRGGRGALVCESFLGEPSIVELGTDGESLNRLINQIAYRLQISPCEFAGQFCLNAAAALGSRAGAIGSYAVNEEGFTRRVEVNTGNLGLLQFVPTASPAIQLIRHLAGVTPLIANLSRNISSIYGKSENRNKINGFRHDDPIGWHLDFLKELTPLMEEAVGYLFVMTCRVLLLQLLRSSRTAIQNRLNNFETYAPLFEQLMLTQLADVAELEQLRDRLRNIMPPTVSAIIREIQWVDATHLVTEVITVRPNQLETLLSPGPEGVILGKDGISRIRDSRNTLWTLEDLEEAIATRRGLAEDIDPLVKQITNLPEVMQRFRIAQQLGLGRTAIRMELRKVLYEMQADNWIITFRVNDDWRYAFQASKIQEHLPSASIPGTSFALQGIHLQAHEQIGEFFQGSSYYAAGINALFNARLGEESLTAFFEFTGLALLAVICPAAAFLAGAGLAVKQYAHAVEQEILYGALIDPELVISRAEVEAELFAAQLGLALSFIPEAGSILRVGRYGIRAVSRAGLAGGTRIVGRYIGRRITREMVEALSRNLAAAFAREVITNVVIDQVIAAVMEPIIREVEREATITGPVGGSQGAEMVRRMLAAERQASTRQLPTGSPSTIRERRD